MLPSSTQTVVRGTSVEFLTTFFDLNGAVTQPTFATINLLYPGTDVVAVTVPMVPPVSPAVQWTAIVDTRGQGVGLVSWSIHSDPGPPFAVEDGSFILTANAANLATFT